MAGSTPRINLDQGVGFKRISSKNWLTIDPAWQFTVTSVSPGDDPAEGWIEDLLRTNLNPAVPFELRKLFEVARATVIYGLVFYPFLTLGAEQILRTAESAVATKCAAMSAPASVRRFQNKIDWLAEQGILSQDEQRRWHLLRYLRNDASHPKDQSIFNPAMSLMILENTAELIDALFA